MSNKIGEALWKAFVKKQKLEVELGDKDLLKALARFDKTDERKPEERLEALNDLIKEIPKQVAALVKLKKQLGDKPFGLVKDELYGILEEAEGLQKKAQAAPKKEDDEDEDEDSKPDALVDPKLLMKQLMMCRKDPERTMKFAFVDAKGKDQPAMLAMHPRMSARALFTKLQAAAGVKTGAFGSAWVDGMSLMLQLDKPLSGLVKKVRGPVKACGFRITKAVLWNEDGTVFEQEDLSDEVDGTAEAATTARAATPNIPPAPPKPSVTYEDKRTSLLPKIKQAADTGSADAPKHQELLELAESRAKANDFLGALTTLKQIESLLENPSPKNEGSSGGVDPGIAFKARLTALLPAIKGAEGSGTSTALDAKLKASEAGVLARKKDFEAANALLDEVERLLASTQGAQRRGGADARQAPDLAAQRAIAKACLVTWRDAKDAADAELSRLQGALRNSGEPALQRIADKGLGAVSGKLQVGLRVALEEFSLQTDPAGNAAEKLRRSAMDLRRFLETDPAVALCDENPFNVPVTLRKTLGDALTRIEREIDAIVQ